MHFNSSRESCVLAMLSARCEELYRITNPMADKTAHLYIMYLLYLFTQRLALNQISKIILKQLEIFLKT